MQEIDQFLSLLFAECVSRLGEVADFGFPVPGEPIDPAWSRAADEYCLRMAARMEYEPPSAEVAAALLPRLNFAKALRTTEDAPPPGTSPVEWCLVTLWHQRWEARWLAKDFGQ